MYSTYQAPRWFQGKMIGLCGDMDGESVSELRDAQRCVLSSGALMAASFQLHEAGKQCAPDKIRAQLRQEQAACQAKRDGLRSPSVDCLARRTMVLHRDDAKCFSTTAIRECRPSCQGHSLRAFHVKIYHLYLCSLTDPCYNYTVWFFLSRLDSTASRIQKRPTSWRTKPNSKNCLLLVERKRTCESRVICRPCASQWGNSRVHQTRNFLTEKFYDYELVLLCNKVKSHINLHSKRAYFSIFYIKVTLRR